MRARTEIRPTTRVRDVYLLRGKVTVGSGSAEGCNRKRDEIGTFRPQRRRVETERLCPQPRVVVHQDIGPVNELAQFGTAALAVQVEADAAFVQIERKESSTLLRVVPVARKRPAPTRHVAFGRLDFNHVGAVVAQQFAGVCRRNAAAEFEYPRWLCHRRLRSLGTACRPHRC